MSGVVIKLDDDEEEDDDVAELLAADNGGGDFGDDRKSGGGLSRRLHKRATTLGGGRGSLAQILNTGCLFAVFFGWGVTKSLIDAQFEAEGLEGSHNREIAHALGFCIGFVTGGCGLGMLSRNFVILIVLVLKATVLAVLPFAGFTGAASIRWEVDDPYGLLGLVMAFLMIACNSACLDFWNKRNSAIVLQALHLSLSLGIMSGTGLVDPLAQTRVPSALQTALNISPIGYNHTASGSAMLVRVRRSEATDFEDPVLARVFGSRPPLPPRKLIPKKKPKPIFTDGKKLDNSRDWDLVKVETVPPEDEMPFTTTPDPIQTNLRQLEKDMKVTADLQAWLNRPETRVKRSNGASARGRPYGEFQPPSRYDQFKPHRPSVNQWPREEDLDQRANGWANNNPYNPYDGGMVQDIYRGEDYPVLNDPYPGHRPPDKALPEHPPEKVEQAIETLGEYLANPGKVVAEEREEAAAKASNSTSTRSTTTTTAATSETTPVQQTSTTMGTTTTTTTKTITTTDVTTTTTQMFVEYHTPSTTTAKVHHHRKPAISFDNDTEPGNSDVTIGKVLKTYGVPKSEVGFILDATYTYLLAFVLLVCMCYRPREPRSARADTSRSDGSDPYQPLDGSRGGASEPAVFKTVLTVLMFFICLLHWIIYSALMQELPRNDDNGINSPRSWFAFTFTGARFLSIFGAKILSPLVTLAMSTSITWVGSILFYIAQVHLAATQAIICQYLALTLLGMGLASILPSLFAWGNCYVAMTWRTVAFVCWSLAFPELLTRDMLGPLDGKTSSMPTLLLVISVSLLMTHCVASLVARRHGTRDEAARQMLRQTSGYELANQEDHELNQDLLDDLDDDEDDEDFEVGGRLVPSGDGGGAASGNPEA